MNEEMKVAEGAASTAQSATAAAGGIESGLDPMRALAALANDLRWGLVWRMASGEELIAVDVAHELGRDPDGVSKHLRVLSDAGVAEARAGEDRRLTVFSIPAAFRPEPGVLDYGFCRLHGPVPAKAG